MKAISVSTRAHIAEMRVERDQAMSAAHFAKKHGLRYSGFARAARSYNGYIVRMLQRG